MKKPSTMTGAAALVATLALAACGGGGGNGASGTSAGTSVIGGSQNAASNAVPDSAGSSGTSLIKFLKTMRNDDETSEPMSMGNSWAMPPDETGEAEG